MVEESDWKAELLEAVARLKRQIAGLAVEEAEAGQAISEELEVRLRRFQDAARTGAVADGAWHDFANVIFGILAYAEGARRGSDPGDCAHHVAADIVGTAQRVIDMVRQRCGSSCRTAHANSADITSGVLRSILVIERTGPIREVVHDMLLVLGHDCVVFEDADKGLAHYRDQWRKIDLVILDAATQNAGGRDCLRGLREVNPHARVLLEVACASEEAIQEPPGPGAVGFLMKPFTLAELSEAVAEVLGR